MVQKGRVLEDIEILRHKVWERKERGVGSTCNKKPDFVLIYHIF
jgi:hypothetical protein